MKKTILMLLFMLPVPVFAGYTYTITEGMEFTDLTLTANQSLLMTGGTGGNVTLEGTSLMELYGGEVVNITLQRTTAALDVWGGKISGRIFTDNDNKVNIAGGDVKLVYLNGSALAKLSGGNIESINVGLNISSTLPPSYIIKCDLNSLNLTYTNGVLSGIAGNWLDGSGFNIGVESRLGNPVSDYIQFVPEPTSMLLLSLGGLLIRRK